ncbi:MAG TPA: NAD(P)-binding protein [Ramlibacter sp.]|nr:NAD(P)-binding protein [Ramlibacter sp.]
MHEPVVEVDYLIKGAGAAGMAFADSLLTESRATIAIVDRHHRPGGHWNHAYPFVRLHQPSAFYGVNSRPLGSGAKDEVGFNKGYYELASGSEVLSYFDLVMRQTFLPSGRVRFFPMSELGDDGTVTSLLSGRRTAIKARKTVDATYSRTTVPSMRPPRYPVAPGIVCVPPNELPRVARPHAAYVVIGAGKTGMDSCLWLLENGADPDRIRWIMPRDYWWINRATYQPGEEFVARLVQSIANGVEALATGDDVDDVFARLEAFDEVRRIDPSVKPRGYHGGFVSEGELGQLRRIRDMVRLGRVQRIDADRIVLERGSIPTNGHCLHIDCTATGIPALPSQPIFAGDRITLQWVRLAQPTFSWSLIGHVEAACQDEAEKNRICTPIPPPDEPRDWLRMMAVELSNQLVWSKIPAIREWQSKSRLDPFTRRIQALKGTQGEAVAHLQRYGKYVGPAARKLAQLLAGA